MYIYLNIYIYIYTYIYIYILPIWKPPGPYGPGRQVAEFEAPGGRRHPAHLAIQPPGTFSSMVHLALSFARSEYGGRL